MALQNLNITLFMVTNLCQKYAIHSTDHNVYFNRCL